MTTTVASIFTAAEELLDVAEVALATTIGGPVVQAFLNPGQPAFDIDCDFVCVWQGGLELAPQTAIPSNQVFRTGPRVHLVTFNITTGRCIHGLQSVNSGPTVNQKNADAEKIMQDAQALWNGVSQALDTSELMQGTCSQLRLEKLAAYVPQGNLAGWNLPVVGQIDGYAV